MIKFYTNNTYSAFSAKITQLRILKTSSKTKSKMKKIVEKQTKQNKLIKSVNICKRPKCLKELRRMGKTSNGYN
jgi:hypothetical protein